MNLIEMLQSIATIITLLISCLALIGGIITVWVNTNVKIAKIETTVNLKIAAIELSIATYIKSNSENLKESFAENKEEHKNIGIDVKEIRDSIGKINVSFAKLTS